MTSRAADEKFRKGSDTLRIRGAIVREVSAIRHFAALVLTIATVAVPLGADHCALTCLIPHGGSKPAAPACHHQASAVQQIGTPSTGCLHNHVTTVSMAPAAPIETSFPVIAAPAALPGLVAAASIARSWSGELARHRLRPTGPGHTLSPLRI